MLYLRGQSQDYDGWADLTAGVKYNLFANPQTQRLLSAGLTYEMPVGSSRALQGNGDGEFHLFLTGGAQIGSCWHWISGSGFRLPADTNEGSQMWYWSNHLDRRMSKRLYLFTEVNWFHWMKSGTNAGLAGIEGGDLINLGSTGVAGNDIVTQAIGAKVKVSRNLIVGLAWEFPLTSRKDVLEDRLTMDVIMRY